MRRIHPEYEFDMWLPALSPPNKLLNDYVIEKKLSWEEFATKFEHSVLRKKKTHDLLLFALVILRDVANKKIPNGRRSIIEIFKI